MFSKLSLLPALSFFFFFGCSGEDIDEIKGKKKEEFNPVANYIVCVASTQACIDAQGEDCFITKNDPQYFTAGGGGVEAFCFDRTAETYLVTETGSM
ncbi:hypothetical protein CH352_14550 [Leptospira hartskeerlii]|uniref:Lipoprotein n=1 Tax=Leptospira hartskeerlii TaxID=2023177 RepID=A0A2M9XCQ5_9LEPT|nr:hypothetical protein [Leptospira hartskeerlii]PJZ25460.1 hypothetical protein CH357_11135 [Leptospira hartskeerlii]PJZ32561.1 hypothetical protein CH352_14550 [Leptospira hartskeerlii]